MTAGHADHSLLVYDTDEAFAERVADFLLAGLGDGEPGVAVYAPHRLELLREALGPAAGDVRFLDADGFYSRPEAALAGYDAKLRRELRDGAPGVRVTGELPSHAGRDPGRWVAYEAILNRAFAGQPVQILCGYDARTVPEPLMRAARRTHPEVLSDDGEGLNPRFLDPALTVATATPLLEPLPGLVTLPAHGDGAAFRAVLGGVLAQAGVSGERADGLLAAADEVLHNARRHGAGEPEVRTGVVDGMFVCEIRDSGAGFDDALAGFLPPRPAEDRGAGLWVARQLTARLDLRSAPDGMTVRLWT